ncbi:MAG: hypothetical protein HUU26_08025 [Gemmatimonadaceae bacterium]|nr:hypothetical protein [Gemmatimonadaceae bacterium]
MPGRTHRLIRAALLAVPAVLSAQGAGTADTTKPRKDSPEALQAAARFYAALEPVAFTLRANVRQLRADTMDDPPARAAVVSIRQAGGQSIEVPITVRTHGRWRLTHCEYPPLSLNFPFGALRGTPLEGLDKARLTSFCRNHEGYEQYVVQELQLYRIYHLLTPYSQRSRLLRVTYVDSASGRTIATRDAFFIEDRDALAARLDAVQMKAQGAVPSDLDPYHSALMGVFQYFIGNTDFHISALHNVLLMGTAAGPIVPIAFDFDYAGAVNTVYAVPQPAFRIPNVRTRLFRGYCAPEAEFRKVFELFNAKRQAIYALYDDPVGKRLRWDVINDTRKYFDEFYRVINDPVLARAEILDRCLRRG